MFAGCGVHAGSAPGCRRRNGRVRLGLGAYRGAARGRGGTLLKEASGVAPFDEVAEERSCSASKCDAVMVELVEELLRRWPERRGTRLSLTGTPAGAAVFDGASLVGTVPGRSPALLGRAPAPDRIERL